MQLFFAEKIDGSIAFLDEVESGHCFRVLRKQVGDEVVFVDGKGNYFEGKILETNKKKTSISIDKKIENWKPLPYKLHIAIAPTKNNDRYEWFLEKATEAGILQITPIKCQRSERRNIKVERYRKVLKTAMKQSLSATLPTITELIDFQTFTKKEFPNFEKYIAWCGAEDLPNLKEKITPKKNQLFLIGPEGDFTKEEFEIAKANGFQPITFGDMRLRTETAGVYCSMITAFVNQ